MILNASQRGGAGQLGAHLLKAENEHVEVHEIRGFVADDLKGAMKEAQAVALGTRCKQHLFSVSISPPPAASVSVAKFEAAIERIEQANGLSGQPRMIVFHTKEGRRHAHAVWSRIDADTMTARPLPFFKTKLREISKGLYLEHGWQLPRGLMDSKEHDPRNFSLGEWQQAKRMGRDPGALKATVQECWAASDNRAAFSNALEARGLYLARGDRRGHVVVTYEGEVLSLARTAGVKTKEIAARLGKPDDLKSVEDTRRHIAETIAPRLGQLIAAAGQARDREMAPLAARRVDMRERHTGERQRLDDGQRMRAQVEAKARAARLRHGVMGLWDRITGQHGRTSKENEAEALQAVRRDRGQRDALVSDQLRERRTLQREIVAIRQRHASRVEELHGDLARQDQARDAPANERTAASFNRVSGADGRPSPPRQILRSRGHGRTRDGPDLGR